MSLSGSSFSLYPHQVEGVHFLARNAGAILADEMGLGKSHTVAATIASENLTPCLIVCPTRLRFFWERVFRDINPGLLVVSPRTEEEIGGDVVLVGYNRLAEWYQSLSSYGFVSLVADEAHLAHNRGALNDATRQAFDWSTRHGLVKSLHRTEALLELSRSIRRITAVTGTPIMRRREQLFNLLRLIRHPLGRSRETFAMRYCGGVRTVHGIEAGGASNDDELLALLRDCVLARRKADVLRLPPKEYVRLEIGLSPEWISRYQSSWPDYHARASSVRSLNALRRLDGAKALTKYTILREMASRAKVESLLAHGQSRPTPRNVLFSHFRSTLEAASALLRGHNIGHVLYHGGMSDSASVRAVDRFQSDDTCHWFLGNTDAAMVGLTLTAADRVYFSDFCWSAAEHDQAADRIHRIGQTRPVSIYFGVASSTLDELHYRLVEETKAATDSLVFQATVDDKDGASVALNSGLAG